VCSLWATEIKPSTKEGSMKSTPKTLIDALRILARHIESDDGVANACIAEAADRLEELSCLAAD